MGVLSGSQEMVRRSLLAYQRSEEQAADSAALRYLSSHRSIPEGHARHLRAFRGERAVPLALGRSLPDQPSPSRRSGSASWRRLAKQSPNFGKKDPPALRARHDLMRAKLFGFVERQETVSCALSTVQHLRRCALCPGRPGPSERPAGGGLVWHRRASRRAAGQRLFS